MQTKSSMLSHSIYVFPPKLLLWLQYLGIGFLFASLYINMQVLDGFMSFTSCWPELFHTEKKCISTETWLLCPKLQIILKGTAFILPAGENSRWFNLFITAELCCSEINKLDWNEIGCFLINREMKNRWKIMKFIICTIMSFSHESIDILGLLSKIEFNFKTK